MSKNRIYEVKVDRLRDLYDRIEIMEGNKKSLDFKVFVTENGTNAVLSTDTTMKYFLEGSRPDGKLILEECTRIENGNCLVFEDIPEYVTFISGQAHLHVSEFDITNNKKYNYTFEFILYIRPSYTNENDPANQSDLSYLSKLILESEEIIHEVNELIENVEILYNENIELKESLTEAETARDLAETSRVSAETARKSAETARVNVESTRVIDDIARTSAETARKSAETSRVSAETTRVNQENARKTNETARQSAETSRVSAETDRVSQENTRKTNETSRVSAETTRVNQENARKTNETARVNVESTRVINEIARISAESTRDLAESSRVSGESNRVSAESLRVSAETTRVNQENTRKTNETARQSAETDRVSQENTRKTNETTRQSAETDRVSQENTRKTNETTRVSQENTRKTNETARQSAESLRASAETDRQTNTSTAITNANLATNKANAGAKACEDVLEGLVGISNTVIDDTHSYSNKYVRETLLGLEELTTTNKTINSAINEVNESVQDLKIVETDITLLTNSWVGTTTPYTYDLGYETDYDVELLTSSSNTLAEIKALEKAKIISNASANTVIAWGTKPTIDIPLMARVTLKKV